MSYKWDYQNLLKHRVNRMVNAIDRRDREYLLERQAKLYRVLPRSLFANAKITFTSWTKFIYKDQISK